MSGQQSGLVAGIEGVDEWVDTGAVSAVGDGSGVGNSGGLWGELGTVLVEGKVAVSGVVGVDEGVEVGVDWSVVVVVIGDSGLWSWHGWSWSESWGSWNGSWSGWFDGFRDERSGVLSGSSSRNVTSVQNSEPVLSGRVLDGVSLTVFADV